MADQCVAFSERGIQTEKAVPNDGRQQDRSDLEKLCPDSEFWFSVLCLMPVCQCRQELLSLYQYEMDADFPGNRVSDELQ